MQEAIEATKMPEIEPSHRLALKQHLARIQPKTLTELHDTFRFWLHIEDTGIIDVNLACALDRKVPGDPVWQLVCNKSHRDCSHFSVNAQVFDTTRQKNRNLCGQVLVVRHSQGTVTTFPNDL